MHFEACFCYAPSRKVSAAPTPAAWASLFSTHPSLITQLPLGPSRVLSGSQRARETSQQAYRNIQPSLKLRQSRSGCLRNQSGLDPLMRNCLKKTGCGLVSALSEETLTCVFFQTILLSLVNILPIICYYCATVHTVVKKKQVNTSG